MSNEEIKQTVTLSQASFNRIVAELKNARDAIEYDLDDAGESADEIESNEEVQEIEQALKELGL